MTLHDHWGHSSLLRALARARQEDTLPAALLIHGARGVGKQHLALWVSRLLLCQDPGASGPCESCRSCYLARKIEHPDLHWYFPLPRPQKAPTPEKLADALEDARLEKLEEFRAKPLRATSSNEARSLYLAAVRNLRKNAQRRPSMGTQQVFIIAEAEMLAPQTSSTEAANALLKLLEEPPPGTTLILTSAEPGRLLPTIRSRTTHLHVPPHGIGEVQDFLLQQAGVPEDEAARAAARSKGAIGRALGFLQVDGEPGPLEETRGEAMGLLGAALAEEPSRRFGAALAFKPVGARALGHRLDFLEEILGELARIAAGAVDGRLPQEEIRFYRDVVSRWNIHPSFIPPALSRVDEARSMAAGNVNPQLIIFGLLHDLRSELTRGRQVPESGR